MNMDWRVELFKKKKKKNKIYLKPKIIWDGGKWGETGCEQVMESKVLSWICGVRSSTRHVNCCHSARWTLRPHVLQHVRLPWPLLSPGICSDSRSLSWWCHPAIKWRCSFCVHSGGIRDRGTHWWVSRDNIAGAAELDGSLGGAHIELKGQVHNSARGTLSSE